MKKSFYVRNVIFSGEMGFEKENEEKSEKKDLCENPGFLQEAILFRSFFFQFLISPGRYGQFPVRWPAANKGALRV